MNYNDILDYWKSLNIRTENDLDAVLENFRILFAYHSSKIENADITYHDTREIFENGKILNYTGDTRAVFDQQNQKLCYDYLKRKILNKDKLSIELIKEIHRILTSGTYDSRRYIENDERPGEFKHHDYITGIHEVGAAANEVEGQLSELIQEVNNYDDENILLTGSYFHLKFENIHPFADGNGRVGRTILNYYFMINDNPPIIIYDDDKALYYQCLQKYDEDEILEPFIKFVEYQAVKTWERTLALAKGEQKEKKKILKDIIKGK